MKVTKSHFGYTDDGSEVFLYTIENDLGMKAVVTDFGAILVSLFVPDKTGKFKDVVLGYDDLETYKRNFDMLGTTVGRNVNRIENGRFQIDGVSYQLDINENNNNIHSHMEHGFHKVLWKAEIIADNSVSLHYHSPDGENGFPGNLDITVTYTLTETNGLVLSYYGISDKKTLINLTNHSYFNLSGHNSGDILDTVVWINADYYTPVKKGTIPTGEIASVNGTPMDFRKPKEIGTDLGADCEQLKLVYGYDHNFVLNGKNCGVRKVATAESRKSGIKMAVYTDLPGLQFYAGNTTRDIMGKEHCLITKNSGFCMESHYYPNSINIPHFPQPVFDKGAEYKTTTIYQFY
jgi:Galactose mutarotase and related enzymes